MPMEPLTLQALRTKIQSLPRVGLAHLPTPVDDCPRAAERIGLHRLLVKRDDCTGLALGGNKVRHHEFILGDALAGGHDVVIQGAASQSNHSRQLAAAGAKLGLDVHLLPKRDAMSDPVQGNHLLTHLFGATLHPIDPDESSIAAKSRLADELRAQGRRPYLIGMGAARSLALAAVAYVDALAELVDQCGADGLPNTIFSCSQGSTQAGLLLGARLLGLSTTVIGINPVGEDHEAFTTPESLLAIANDAAEILEVDTEISIGEIHNLTGFVGDGYGIPSAAGLRALDLLGATEGILLDPVYTSKAFAGMMAVCREEGIDDALFLHTGGIPALFAYADGVASAVAAGGS